MNRVARDNPDIAVAFASSTKVTQTLIVNPRQVYRIDAKPNDLTLPPPPPVMNPSSPPHKNSRIRKIVKTMLRIPAKAVYRLTKPLLRPIAFRARAYLLKALQTELTTAHNESLKHHESVQLRLRTLEAELSNTLPESHRLDEATQLRLGAIQAELDGIFGELRKLHEAAQLRMGDIQTDLGNIRHELSEYRGIFCTHDELQELRHDLLQRFDHLNQRSLEEWWRHSALLAHDARSAHDPLPPSFFDSLERLALMLTEMDQRQLRQLDRVERYALAAAKRLAVYSGGGEVLVRTEVGYVLCLGSDHALVSTLTETGDLEIGTRLLIQRLLAPNDVFIDVGANVGLHTLAAARAMNGQGKIIAFEPFPATAQLLTRSIWLNGFSDITTVHQAAVATSPGKLVLHLGKTSGHHSIFPLEEGESSQCGKIEVPAIRIDDVIDAAMPVALLKIDVEGAELQVLETARNTILRNPGIAIIAELGPSHLRRTGQTLDEWLGAFSGLGLEYRAINPETGALETWKAEDLQSTESINLLFAKTGSRILIG